MMDPLDGGADRDDRRHGSRYDSWVEGLADDRADGRAVDWADGWAGPRAVSWPDTPDRDDRQRIAGDPVHVTGPLWSEDVIPQQTPAQPGQYDTHVPPAPPAQYDGSPPGPRPGPVRRPRRVRRPGRRRPVRRLVLALLAAVLATPVGTYAWADTKLDQDVDLEAFGDRHPSGKGTNYLIVGSDSRDGLTGRDKRELHAGGGGGRRTDSMMLLHTGANGTTMLSLPRDSWVTIPGYTSPRTGKRKAPAKNKLNAAYAMGGPKMLVGTVEHNTGLRVDHYAEIGFAGFVNLVDAVGGVRMCLEKAVKDEKSGADLTKGCQTLDGTAALAFVRQRHQEAGGDLGRTRNQQKFLSALAHQAAAPGTVLDPSELYPLLNAGLDTLVVDRGTGLRDLTSLFRAVQNVTGGRGSQINVPVAGGIATSKGSALRWDGEESKKLFGELKHDLPVTAPPEKAH